MQVELLICDQSGAVSIWDIRRAPAPPHNPRPLVRAPCHTAHSICPSSCPRARTRTRTRVSGSLARTQPPHSHPHLSGLCTSRLRCFLGPVALALRSTRGRGDAPHVNRSLFCALAAAASRAVRRARLRAVRHGGPRDHSRRRRQLARTQPTRRALLLVLCSYFSISFLTDDSFSHPHGIALLGLLHCVERSRAGWSGDVFFGRFVRRAVGGARVWRANRVGRCWLRRTAAHRAHSEDAIRGSSGRQACAQSALQSGLHVCNGFHSSRSHPSAEQLLLSMLIT